MGRANGVMMQRFVDELLATPRWNASEAAKRAGYSANNAGGTGARLLADPTIREAILERLAERRQRLEVSQDQLLEEITRLAYADPADFLTWEEDGRARLKPSRLLGPERRAIQSIDFNQDGSVRSLRFVNKESMLRLLALHVGDDKGKSMVLRLVALDPQTGLEMALPLPPIESDEDGYDDPIDADFSVET